MKRITFVGLFLVAAVILCAGILLLGKGVEAVNVKINKKDFPEHGITIISPSDQSFDQLMARLAGRTPGFPVEELKPFSIFIKNTGNHPIVAYKLRWECVKEDGTIIYKDSSFSAAWILMDSGPEHEKSKARATTIIRPNSTWFISLNSDPLSLAGSATNPEDLNRGHGVIHDPEQYNQLVLDSEKIAVLRQSVAKEMAQYTNITIILDGAFFDDGSFVGQDGTGFFEAVKAEIDANKDLLSEIRNGLQQRKALGEIFKAIEDLAAEPDVSLGPDSTPPDYYKYHKKEAAREYLGYRRAWGEDYATKHALQQLNKLWAKLRKL
jgi:hypothetical protein